MQDSYQLIETCFPGLTPGQRDRFARLEGLYREWNEKINVISRKDMDAFWSHHVLHSLAIARLIRFVPGTRIMDVGTGGGFPGIPLAIMFPECDFLLVDSIGKKIKVVEGVRDALGLRNVRACQTRVEEVREKFDFIVSRAVTAFPAFVAWVKKKVLAESRNALPNGILYLKGGDFGDEIAPFAPRATVYNIPDLAVPSATPAPVATPAIPAPLVPPAPAVPAIPPVSSDFSLPLDPFAGPFFETKKIIHLAL